MGKYMAFLLGDQYIWSYSSINARGKYMPPVRFMLVQNLMGGIYCHHALMELKLQKYWLLFLFVLELVKSALLMLNTFSGNGIL